MKAIVNGEPRELPEGTTLAALLEMLETPRSGIAVARNEHVVRRAQFDSLIIEDGDFLEIIKAVAGG